MIYISGSSHESKLRKSVPKARTSLQRPLNDQIVTFEAVWMFCSTSFEDILFYMIRKDEMSPIREKLNERYKLGNTVEGTRSLHHFHPLSTTKIQAKYLSVETNYSISHSFLQSDEDEHKEFIASLKINDYITCIYGDYWWLARIIEIDSDEKDVLCSFMHPHGYAENFYFPKKDEVYVPFSKILLKVETPKILSSSARHYSITKKEIQITEEEFSKRK